MCRMYSPVVNFDAPLNTQFVRLIPFYLLLVPTGWDLVLNLLSLHLETKIFLPSQIFNKNISTYQRNQTNMELMQIWNHAFQQTLLEYPTPKRKNINQTSCHMSSRKTARKSEFAKNALHGCVKIGEIQFNDIHETKQAVNFVSACCS